MPRDSDQQRRKIDEQKEFFDAVTKAWLDEKFAAFGRNVLKILLAILFIWFLKAVFLLNTNDLRSAMSTMQSAHDLIK